MRNTVLVSAMALALAACGGGGGDSTSSAVDQPAASEPEMSQPAAAPAASITVADAVAHERRDERRARDDWRHPQETLEFFGIESDMTVVEVLPGSGGWYTQILAPLTAEEGRLVGVTYPESLWVQMFGSWDADRAERFGANIANMGTYLSVDGVEPAQPVVGYTIDDIPDAENGQADAVLFFRAMHHLFRFDEPMVDTALGEIFDMLAPGGVVGVVQHRTSEDAAADFATGDNGYLKQSDVVAAFERAGFTLEDSSEINANPNDPADGPVWRLPPTTSDNPDTMAIGESDRMTLRFRKPG